MKIIFSPSKTMDFETSNISKVEGTKALYNSKALEIIKELRTFSLDVLEKKLKLKADKLLELLSKFGNFELLEEKIAIEAYTGISFKQLELKAYTKKEWDFIENNVFILSALYGINRGTDLIKNHRLDMTMKIFHISPYEYWKETINNSELLEEKTPILNLASKEFSKLIDTKKFNIINVEFLEEINGAYKSISTNSKKARGLMLNYIIKNKTYKVEDLKKFNASNYVFSKEKSNENNLVFLKRM